MPRGVKVEERLVVFANAFGRTPGSRRLEVPGRKRLEIDHGRPIGEIMGLRTIPQEVQLREN